MPPAASHARASAPTRCRSRSSASAPSRSYRRLLSSRARPRAGGQSLGAQLLDQCTCYLVANFPEVEMSPEPTCLQCSRIISSQDTIERDGDRVVHLDCRRPRRLTREEQALLYEYCCNHVVARCVSCARSFRQHQLSAGLFGDDTDLCPRC